MRETNKRIIAKRKKSGITQIEMAKRLGLKISTYSQMERSGKIYDEMLVKIADILDVDVRYFLYGEEYLKEKQQKIVIEEPKEEIDDFYDEEERYLILTYRNLRADDKKAAYRLFMQHFNINTISQKRRERKIKKRKSRNENHQKN